jgi:hypothetical protein
LFKGKMPSPQCIITGFTPLSSAKDVRSIAHHGRYGIIAVILVCGLMFGLTAEAGAQQNRLLRQAKEALEKADPYVGDWQGDHTYDDGSDSGQIRNIWLVELSRS